MSPQLKNYSTVLHSNVQQHVPIHISPHHNQMSINKKLQQPTGIFLQRIIAQRGNIDNENFTQRIIQTANSNRNDQQLQFIGSGGFSVAMGYDDLVFKMLIYNLALSLDQGLISHVVKLRQGFVEEYQIQRVVYEKSSYITPEPIEIFVFGSFPIIISRKAKGKTLYDIMNLGANVDRIMDMCLSLKNVLTILHDGNTILHCDMKSDNIFFDFDTNKIQLIDFGNSYSYDNLKKRCRQLYQVPNMRPIISQNRYFKPLFMYLTTPELCPHYHLLVLQGERNSALLCLMYTYFGQITIESSEFNVKRVAELVLIFGPQRTERLVARLGESEYFMSQASTHQQGVWDHFGFNEFGPSSEFGQILLEIEEEFDSRFTIDAFLQQIEINMDDFAECDVVDPE